MEHIAVAIQRVGGPPEPCFVRVIFSGFLRKGLSG